MRPVMTLAAAMALLLPTAARAAGDAEAGKAAFNRRCAVCHSVAAGQNKVGPSLHGVFNRRAGELSDYRYSPALKRSGIVWTADTLDAFIADSQQFLPANRMPYAGMPNAADRADLIAYLQQVAK